MENYFLKLQSYSDYPELSKFNSENICPFLFYNLIPYIYTLSNKGWFDWARKKTDIEWRKDPTRVNFKTKDINRVFDNEILVRCPNPQNEVVAGIGIKSNGKITVRILKSSQTCPAGHKHLDEFHIPADKPDDFLEYSRLFPQKIISCFTRELSSLKIFCAQKNFSLLQINKIIFPCRYHKSNSPKNVRLCPKDFCPNIYQLFYPVILAKMYNAELPKQTTLIEPVENKKVTLEIEKKPLIHSRIIKLLIKFLRKSYEKLFYPVDLLDYSMQVKVINNPNASCIAKTGNSYNLGLTPKDLICPASFYTLYPYILLAKTNTYIDWGQDKSSNHLIPCPDCVGCIYSLTLETKQ